MAAVRSHGIQTDSRSLLDTLSLSERQLLAATNFMRGFSKAESCEMAGYNPASAVAVFGSAKMQAAIAALCERFLVGELAPAAIHTISSILADKNAAAGVRANLAVSVLDRAGFSAKRFEQRAGEAKDPSQMDGAELQAAIDKLQAEIDGRLVDVTPHSEPIDTQAYDFIE